MLLKYVMAAMFLVLPGFWITALTWAGFRAGNIAQNLSEGTRGAGNAGGKGAGAVSSKLK